MELKKAGEIPKSGKMILIYGESGTGKTTSCFQTLPKPLLYLQSEPRNPRDSIDAANDFLSRTDQANRMFSEDEITVAPITTWDDMLRFVTSDIYNQTAFLSSIKSIVVDSYSYLMNVVLSNEIEDEIFNTKDAKEKLVKPLINKAKLSLEGYGGMAAQMVRCTKALQKLSLTGKIVVITALLEENPKWDRDLAAAPRFKGREFSGDMPGLFDLIGLVRKRFDDQGNTMFPPHVAFEGSGFLCKFTGVKAPGAVAQGALDFGKILRIA